MDYQTYHSSLYSLFAHVGAVLSEQENDGISSNPNVPTCFPICHTYDEVLTLLSDRKLKMTIYRMDSGKSFELVMYFC